MNLLTKLTALVSSFLIFGGCSSEPVAEFSPSPRPTVQVTASASASSTFRQQLTLVGLSFSVPAGWNLQLTTAKLIGEHGIEANIAQFPQQQLTQAQAETLCGRLLPSSRFAKVEAVKTEFVAKETINSCIVRGRAQADGKPVEWSTLLATGGQGILAVSISNTDAAKVEANLAGLLAIQSSLALEQVNSPTPTPSPTHSKTPQASALATPSTTQEAEPHLYFTTNLQWTVPASWKEAGQKWLTPDGLMVKYWPTSEKGELNAKLVASLLQDSTVFTGLEVKQSPNSLVQGDFRLWMFGGQAHKQNAKKQSEPVDWQACVAEPLKPVKKSGHYLFIAVGPRGQQTQCRESLLKLTDTIEQSKSGETPTKIQIHY